MACTPVSRAAVRRPVEEGGAAAREGTAFMRPAFQVWSAVGPGRSVAPHEPQWRRMVSRRNKLHLCAKAAGRPFGVSVVQPRSLDDAINDVARSAQRNQIKVRGGDERQLRDWRHRVQ